VQGDPLPYCAGVDLQPYPHARWPKLTRRDAHLLGRCARLARGARPGRGVGAVAAVLGHPLRVEPGMPWLGCVRSLAPRTPEVPLALSLAGAAGGRALIVLELDGALGAWAVARALGLEPNERTSSGPLTATEQGVLAYTLARALAASGHDFCVTGSLPSRSAMLGALGDGPILVWPARVHAGDRWHGARLLLPAATLDALPLQEGAADLPPLRALRGLRIGLVAEAGMAHLPLAEVRSLRPGDVLVLDEAWVGPRVARAEVRVRAAGARRTAWWCTAEPGGLRLTRIEQLAEQPVGEGRRMMGDEDTTTTTAVERLGDAPVEVTVELARFSLALEELGRIAPGEVLVTGRAVGERVVLRAADRAIATGELVDVDGEVGVRVTRLL
jgi:type III secretion protein Q